MHRLNLDCGNTPCWIVFTIERHTVISIVEIPLRRLQQYDQHVDQVSKRSKS